MLFYDKYDEKVTTMLEEAQVELLPFVPCCNRFTIVILSDPKSVNEKQAALRNTNPTLSLARRRILSLIRLSQQKGHQANPRLRTVYHKCDTWENMRDIACVDLGSAHEPTAGEIRDTSSTSIHRNEQDVQEEDKDEGSHVRYW
jgi:hypothetical protein